MKARAVMTTTTEILFWSDTPSADGVVFSKQAVESVVGTLNDNARAMAGIVNHDLSTIPFRKFVRARVIEESGKYGAEVTMAIGEAHQVLTHDVPDAELVLLEWQDDPKLFARIGQEGAGEETKVTADLGDFEGLEQYEVFRHEIDATDGVTPGNPMGRHSVDPTPIIEIVLANWEAIAILAGSKWCLSRAERFVTGVTDELLARRVGPTCDLIEAKLADLRGLFARTRGKSDENVCVCLIASSDEIELVLLVSAGSEVERIDLYAEQLGEILDRYSSILDQADSAVLSLHEDGTWRFEYARLKDGNAIGTLDCAERTLEQLRAIGDTHKTRDDG